MKTCKGIWTLENCECITANNERVFLCYEKNVFTAIPLSEFEAYKQKTKQAIDFTCKNCKYWRGQYQCEEGKLSNFCNIAMLKNRLKKELEL